MRMLPEAAEIVGSVEREEKNANITQSTVYRNETAIFVKSQHDKGRE